MKSQRIGNSNIGEKVIEINPESVSEFLEEYGINHWKDTVYEKYALVTNKRKGDLGEKLVFEHFQKKGHEVKDAEGEAKGGGYDLIVDGYKTEVKFSLALKREQDIFVINHIGMKKDWERLIFLGIQPDLSPILFWVTKDDVRKTLKDTKFLRKQQGGKKGDNDDWMSAGKSAVRWLNSDYSRAMEGW